MNVFEAIKTRRSIRRYREKPVEQEKLNKVLEAARLAPSAANRQPWKFIVVTDAEVKEKLRKAVEDLVGTLLKRSPIILKFAKMAVNKALETPLSVGLAYESDLCALCFGTEDLKEGARAFSEKRTPVFKGK